MPTEGQDDRLYRSPPQRYRRRALHNEPAGAKHVRCPICGAWLKKYPPCVACIARQYRENSS